MYKSSTYCVSPYHDSSGILPDMSSSKILPRANALMRSLIEACLSKMGLSSFGISYDSILISRACLSRVSLEGLLNSCFLSLASFFYANLKPALLPYFCGREKDTGGLELYFFFYINNY